MKKNSASVGDVSKETYYSPQHFLDSDAKDNEKLITSKYDFDLYNKELDVINDVFHVKFNHTDSRYWSFFKNNVFLLKIEESCFTPEQLVHLHSVCGFTMLIQVAKCGKSVEESMKIINYWLSSTK